MAKELGKLGVVWSCNAKANVQRSTLKISATTACGCCWSAMKCGNQQILHNIKKGMLVDVAQRFTKDCHELGIVIHGTFILGLPGETSRNHQETLNFAKEINPHTIQVSLAAPYPGTFLLQAGDGERLARRSERRSRRTTDGMQIAPLHYPHLSHSEIFNSVEDFYKHFYFRPRRSPRSSARWCAAPR